MPPPERLSKTLTLFDVYAICTGAMFSAEFFILPGLAMAFTGPSVVVAYLVSGLLVLPAMFSQAELATAMPRAGGTYYFIDRALGPLVGTIGGIGTWLSLIFKSAFALIGIGAYLVLFVELPIKPVAVALTIGFTLLNIFGAKETSGLQRVLVTTLIAILTLFVLQGLVTVFSADVAEVAERKFTPFLTNGMGGLFATIGLVFAAYTGLTKVASVAEEVQNPDRNIPLGMFLSLGTAIFVYTVGVYVLVAVLDPAELMADLTPIASAAAGILAWIPTPPGLPQSTGVLLVAIAAMAAFASTGNAGILSASRYPLAMARDRLITQRLGGIGAFGTPTAAILLTGIVTVLFLVLFNVEGVAKLASAFNLLVFGLINLAVVVMRESRIPSYAPGFVTPFYPWVQIIGILTSVVLIVQIGTLSILFTVGVVALSFGWYAFYGQHRVEREGAIYHLFERLGRRRYEGLDAELRTILKEKGLPEESPFESLVTRADVLDFEGEVSYDELIARTAVLLAERIDVDAEQLRRDFEAASSFGATPVIAAGAALPHLRLPDLDRPELVMVRCRTGISLDASEPDGDGDPVYALFFLVSPEDAPSMHLRILASIASRIDEEHFMEEWAEAPNEQKLKETLLHHERYLSLRLRPDTPAAEFIGKALRDLHLPPGNLVALVRRHGHLLVPSGSTVLEEGDQITIIGEPKGIERLYETYGKGDVVGTM
jgi:APA family basic amino acid/polyamine antiporter